ncbi:cytochrome P450 6k1-like [Diabrotica undecimpunctata]|uniref:cytochrome P450 6k1-like n=1 Tax=Diabrotica undecimpunctata TaxID=50387 RepID=UPI003B637605
MIFFNWNTLFLFGLVIYLLYKYLTRNHNYWKEKGVPYEEPYFLAGNFWEVFSGKRQIGKHLGYLYSKYNTPYFGIYILGKPYLVLRNPEIIKNITIRDFKNFDDRTFACDKNADDMAANSLFIMRNPDWKYIRAKLTPIFTSGKLKLMLGIMKDAAREMQNYLSQCDNKIVEMKDVSSKFLTDIVASCFFGYEVKCFRNDESDFVNFTKNLFSHKVALLPFFRLFSYFFVPTFVSLFKLNFLDNTLLKKIIIDTLYYREANNVKRNDFIDLLKQLNTNCREEDCEIEFGTDRLISQLITFYIAGFETTSNAVAFALYELGLRTDCQDRLREEILSIIKTEEDITYENLQKLKYLDMVLSETLRRYPFGPFLNRRCREDYVIEQTGLVIEKGTPVLIPLDGLHYDPEYFPNPEVFDPDRFVDGNKHRYFQSCVYMPFGMGPRNCIGDRFGLICAKIGLVYFLRKFKIDRCAETPDKMLLNPRSPFMVPLNGIKMTVHKV